MRRRLPPLLAMALCLVFFARAATAEDIHNCDPYPDVPINIKPVFDQPTYDFSQNLASIQDIASDHQHSIPQYHEITMGITRYDPVLEFHVPIEIVTPPSGLVCAHVQHVDVTIGYRDVTVFIASEIPRDSCAFDETMGHEQKHIDVNQHILDEFVPLIEERFKSYLKLNGVLQVEHANYAEKVLTDKLHSIMDEIVGQLEQENIRRQREVDSPEEYNRLAHVCNGDLSKIAAQYQRGR